MAAMSELDQRLKAIEAITDAMTGEHRTLAESIKRFEALAESIKRIEGWMARAEPVMRTMIDNPPMTRDEIEKTISAKAFPPPGMSRGIRSVEQAYPGVQSSARHRGAAGGEAISQVEHEAEERGRRESPISEKSA